MFSHSEKRIIFITQGNIDHASSRIRAVNYFPHFRENGYTVFWIPRIPRKFSSWAGRRIIFPVLKRINSIRIIGALLFVSFDFLFVQRHFLVPFLLRVVRMRKRKIIYDLDDALYIGADDWRAREKTVGMIKNADLVIAGSPVLKKFAAQYNTNVTTITSPVKIETVKTELRNREVITIGWIGSEWTSKYLDQLDDVFRKLRESYKVSFLFVGCKTGVLSGINPEIVPWSLEKEAYYLSRMDIGIMPLNDGDFEKGKGGYKLFQYMAAELPVIATPVGINKDIVIEGKNGFLCKSGEEWYSSFVKLIEDDQLRKKMGENGRQEILEKYSLEVCFTQLKESLEKI